ncbi:MAG: hypothetical protein O2788_00335 [Chloroflexi bacterium]|nr:hypothetical protein [Chloroflexota bacterium]
MPNDEAENRRFGRIRGIGGTVSGAARSVTGQSTADQIREFSGAYTEVVKGLNTDIQMLSRRVAQLEAEKNTTPPESEMISQPGNSFGIVIASVALVASVIAVVLAIAT